jgi:hypothetical protein
MHSIIEEQTTLEVNSPEFRASDAYTRERLRETYGQTSFNGGVDDMMSSIHDLVLRPIANETIIGGDLMMRQTGQSEFERLNALNLK